MEDVNKFNINNVEEWKEKLTNVVGYQSPIELIMEPLETSITDKAVEVVQRYGFKVDKFELRKALAYDRDQYQKEYADGLAQAKAESREESHRIDEITRRVKSDIMNGARTIEHGTEEEKYHLLDVIASLHNELHKEMTGAYYDYMHHWANLGYGGQPNDSLYKDIVETEGEL